MARPAEEMSGVLWCKPSSLRSPFVSLSVFMNCLQLVSLFTLAAGKLRGKVSAGWEAVRH